MQNGEQPLGPFRISSRRSNPLRPITRHKSVAPRIQCLRLNTRSQLFKLVQLLVLAVLVLVLQIVLRQFNFLVHRQFLKLLILLRLVIIVVEVIQVGLLLL